MAEGRSELVLCPKKGKITRPPNAFMIFAREFRSIFQKRNPNKNNKVISKLLGDAWKMLDTKKRVKYFQLQEDLKRQHSQRYPGYRYDPRVARKEKEKRLATRGRKRKFEEYSDRNTEHQVFIPSEPHEPRQKDTEWVTNELPQRGFPTSEYVPNNPDYFTNPDEIAGLSSHSSDRFSEPTLDSDYDPTEDLLNAVGRAASGKYGKEKSSPNLEPYKKAIPKACEHSKGPEPSGIGIFPSSSHFCCHEPEPKAKGQCCSSNSSQLPCTQDCRNMGYSYRVLMPIEQTLSCQSHSEAHQRCCQNVQYFPQQSMDSYCCHSHLLQPYQNRDYYQCELNSNISRRPKFQYLSETRPVLHSQFTPLLPESVQFNLQSQFRHSFPPEPIGAALPPESRHPFETARLNLLSEFKNSLSTERTDLPPECTYPFTPDTTRSDIPHEIRRHSSSDALVLNLSPEFTNSVPPDTARSKLFSEPRYSLETTRSNLLPEFKNSSAAAGPDFSFECRRPVCLESIEPDSSSEFRHSPDLPSEYIHPYSSETARPNFYSEIRILMNSPETAMLDSPLEYSKTARPDLPPESKHPCFSQTEKFDLPPESKYSPETSRPNSSSEFGRAPETSPVSSSDSTNLFVETTRMDIYPEIKYLQETSSFNHPLDLSLKAKRHMETESAGMSSELGQPQKTTTLKVKHPLEKAKADVSNDVLSAERDDDVDGTDQATGSAENSLALVSLYTIDLRSTKIGKNMRNEVIFVAEKQDSNKPTDGKDEIF